MLRAAGLALLLALAGAGAARAQSCEDGGTWAGTLDGAPLMIQFNFDRLGSYYVGSSLQGGVLRPRLGQPQDWDEYDEDGHRSGVLHLACDGDTLRGQRIGRHRERSTLVAQRTEPGAFNRRRLAAVQLVVQRELTQQGRVLELVAPAGFPRLVTLRIREPVGAEAAVNAQLASMLLAQLDNHLQCQALVRAQGRFDQPGGDTLSMQHVDWRGTILSVQFWVHGSCGGWTGYAENEPFTFDTATGAQLSLGQWLQPAYREGVAAGTPLHDALVLPQVLRGRHALAELPEARRDCAEFELAEKAAPFAVEPRGMLFGFHYSYSMTPCGLNFLLPWERLAPYLSDDGRHWLQAMQPQR
jgi:hypothetical protein